VAQQKLKYNSETKKQMKKIYAGKITVHAGNVQSTFVSLLRELKTLQAIK